MIIFTHKLYNRKGIEGELYTHRRPKRKPMIASVSCPYPGYYISRPYCLRDSNISYREDKAKVLSMPSTKSNGTWYFIRTFYLPTHCILSLVPGAQKTATIRLFRPGVSDYWMFVMRMTRCIDQQFKTHHW